jgi:hypothetical protein
VWQASYSTFSATTSNPSNNWSVGTVALSDDDSGAAMFNATNLKPGASGSNCIKVSYTGNLAAAVKLYSANESQTKSLDQYLDLTITEGTGGGFSGCSGFTSGSSVYSGTLKAFKSKSSFATGVGDWAPTSSADKTFKFDYTVDSGIPDSSQGGTAQVDFTWEAQNS